MTGTLTHLFLACLVFVGGHFVLGSPPVREALVARIGERAFRGVFSLAALVALIWMVRAYDAAPYRELWAPAAWARYVPLLVMPVAVFLLVAGLTTPNPTAVGQEGRIGAGTPAPGIMKITRHPSLWAFGLWGLAHIPPNGDAASILLFGSIAVLAFAGMPLLDRKARARFGSAWGPVALTTSILPFAAILAGRTRLRFAEIGWWRVVAALALYVALLEGHLWIGGVSPLPA